MCSLDRSRPLTTWRPSYKSHLRARAAICKLETTSQQTTRTSSNLALENVPTICQDCQWLSWLIWKISIQISVSDLGLRDTQLSRPWDLFHELFGLVSPFLHSSNVCMRSSGHFYIILVCVFLNCQYFRIHIFFYAIHFKVQMLSLPSAGAYSIFLRSNKILIIVINILFGFYFCRCIKYDRKSCRRWMSMLRRLRVKEKKAIS